VKRLAAMATRSSSEYGEDCVEKRADKVGYLLG
jgi:hypothetical protein